MSNREEARVWLDPEQKEAADSIVDSSKERSEMWDMSRSEVLRELIDYALEHIGDKEALEELIDPLKLRLWQNKQAHDERRRVTQMVDYAGGWRDRVRGYLNDRLAGKDPYPPEKVETLLWEGYWGDIVDNEIDPETLEPNEEKIEEHREWAENMMRRYREAYVAKQKAPQEAFDGHDDIETGEDIFKLQGSLLDFFADIERRAEAEAYDPDSIYRAVASEYAVQVDTVELAVEKLTPEDTDPRRALKDGEGILGAVDYTALTEWSPEEAEELGEVDGPTLDRSEAVDVIDTEPADPQLTGAEEVEAEIEEETSTEISTEPDTDTSTQPEEAEVEADTTEPTSEASTEITEEADTVEEPEEPQPTEEDVEPPEHAVEKAVELIEDGAENQELYNVVRKHVWNADEGEAVIEEARDRVEAADGEEISVDTEASTGDSQTATDGGEAGE